MILAESVWRELLVVYALFTLQIAMGSKYHRGIRSIV